MPRGNWLRQILNGYLLPLLTVLRSQAQGSGFLHEWHFSLKQKDKQFDDVMAQLDLTMPTEASAKYLTHILCHFIHLFLTNGIASKFNQPVTLSQIVKWRVTM